MRVRLAVIVVCALLAACACLAAQLADQPSKAQDTKKAKKDEVTGGADLLKASWGKTGLTLMKGHVWFQHGDTRLTSDLVEYDSRENVKTATSPGRITITDPECEITGEKGSADFRKKLGVLEGSVVMDIKPKPSEKQGSDSDKESAKNKFRKPTLIKCARIDYLYKQKIATAKGGVTFEQDKRRAHADEAVFDRNKDLLTLIGNVEAVDEEGQTFSSPEKIVISLKEGDEWIWAPKAKATFKIDLGEEEKPETP